MRDPFMLLHIWSGGKIVPTELTLERALKRR